VTILQQIDSRFALDAHGTTIRREILAGITTFVTMAYIIVINPAILSSAGVPREASITVTILIAAFGTLLMGLYANRPFAVAPLMGENAFVAYTMVLSMGYSWQMAMGAVFLSGLIFIVLTHVGARASLAEAIPTSLKHSAAAGIGLFLTFIGLVDMGLVVRGEGATPVRFGDPSALPVLLSIGGFILIAILQARKIQGSMLIGIVVTSVAGILMHAAAPPSDFFGTPASIAPLAFQLDIKGVLSLSSLTVIFTVFVMAFVDTLGSLFGLASSGRLLDKNGNLPHIERPMMVDALATTAAGLLGTATTGAYIESAAGIQAGGRTGLTAIVVACLFLLSLVVTPLVTSVPAFAYAPCLVVVGFMMAGAMRHIPGDDLTESIPAYLSIALMVFTFNIGIGMTAGFVLYPILKVASGRGKEVKAGMWFLGVMALAFYVVAPLHR
jgi:adenine/guanine/hypoxanthine permease